MIENAAVQGARFLEGLRSIRANTIREVRGRGLMLAIELHPEAGDARRYCEALQGRGILVKDTHEHTIRIAPPPVITSDQVDGSAGRAGACPCRKPHLAGERPRIGRCCCAMRDLCRLIGWMVVDLIRSRAALEAEIWTLRQEKAFCGGLLQKTLLQRYRPIDIRWSVSIVS